MTTDTRFTCQQIAAKWLNAATRKAAQAYCAERAKTSARRRWANLNAAMAAGDALRVQAYASEGGAAKKEAWAKVRVGDAPAPKAKRRRRGRARPPAPPPAPFAPPRAWTRSPRRPGCSASTPRRWPPSRSWLVTPPHRPRRPGRPGVARPARLRGPSPHPLSTRPRPRPPDAVEGSSLQVAAARATSITHPTGASHHAAEARLRVHLRPWPRLAAGQRRRSRRPRPQRRRLHLRVDLLARRVIALEEDFDAEVFILRLGNPPRPPRERRRPSLRRRCAVPDLAQLRRRRRRRHPGQSR